MSTSDAPAPAPAPTPSEQVTATPPNPASESIALPPAATSSPTSAIAPSPPPLASPKFVRRLRILDNALAVLVIAFAFEAACFRALNSDVFLHLAAGRAVTAGQLLGPDPFSFTTSETWVNHAWLTDLVSYFLFRLDGERGVVLVLLKALLVAVLAWLMLRTATQQGRLTFIPVLCVLLAVVTLSPGLLLQPHVLSLLLLGVTLWLLERGRAGDKRSLWFLPPVCLLWVNLDAWFLLGPLTIGLYLLGEYLQTIASEEKETPAVSAKQLGIVLFVSVAACLVNPFHVRAFTLPAPLHFGEAATTFASDDAFSSLYLAPWEEAYFDLRSGLSAAGLAYFVLLAAGLGSFAMTAPRWRWWRVLLWLGFAVLSLLNVGAIPFFAVVAGPITALNFLDGAAARFGAEIKGDLNSRQLAVVNRFLSLTAALALLVLGVAGRLQALPHNQREIGVGIHADEGLRDAAKQVAAWREEGAIAPDSHFFNVSPEGAHYLAYYSPGAKTFLDARLTPFSAAVASDYLTARQALHGFPSPKDRDKEKDKDEKKDKQDEKSKPRDLFAWRGIFGNAERKVDYVVFSTPDVLTPIAGPTMRRLNGNPREFTPTHFGGAASIYSWRDPNDPTPRVRDAVHLLGAGTIPTPGQAGVAPWCAALGSLVANVPTGVDFAALAFDSGCEPAAPSPPTPPAPSWYHDLLPHGLPHVAERNLAWQHLAHFEGMRTVTEDRLRRDAITFEAGIGFYRISLGWYVGFARMGAISSIPFVDGSWYVYSGEPNVPRDRGPSESLYLAIRAARRSLQQAPRDAVAYRVLAQAYLALRENTREQDFGWTPEGQGLAPTVFFQIRLMQTIVALREAIDCEPENDLKRDLHGLLAEAYRQQGFRDLQVKHVSDYLELLRGSRPTATLTARRLKEAVESTEKALDKMNTELKTSTSVYNVNAGPVKEFLGTKGRRGKIDYALQNGLAEKALELFEANAKEIDRYVGAQAALRLTLRMGRLDKARQVLGETEEEKAKNRRGLGTHQIGLPAYEWYLIQYAAASGDYQLAFDTIRDAIEIARERVADGWAWRELKQMKDFTPEQQTAMRTAWSQLRFEPHGGRAFNDPQKATEWVLRESHLATLHALMAWLKLEVGDPQAARQEAKESLKYSLALEQAMGTRGIAALVLELTDPQRRPKPVR